MRKSRGSWWWAQISRALAYGVMGVLSAGLAWWVSSGLPEYVRPWIWLFVWALGLGVIEIRVGSEPVTEEEIKDRAD